MSTDPGMSKDQAQALAELVRKEHPRGVSVAEDGAFYIVEVVIDSGRWTLYDAEDWPAWRSRIGGA